MDLSRLHLKESFEGILSTHSLREVYLSVTSKLNQEEPLKTLHEELVYKEFRKITNLKILRSFWIGKRNIDLFIPSVRTQNGFRGLAIEVDGGVHNTYSKMLRDEYKDLTLKELNIAVISVRNPHFKRNTFLADLRGIKALPRLDSRARSRLMRNIYLYTVLKNCSIAELKTLFPSKTFDILKSIKTNNHFS